MPCRDEGRGEYEYAQLLASNDKLAQMLCATCHACEDAGVTLPDNTQEWWDEHKKQDLRDAVDESRRLEMKAIANMTPDELKARWREQHPPRR